MASSSRGSRVRTRYAEVPLGKVQGDRVGCGSPPACGVTHDTCRSTQQLSLHVCRDTMQGLGRAQAPKTLASETATCL